MIGQQISHYRIEAEMLIGESESLYQAEDTRSNEVVYLTFVNSLDRDLAERFQRRTETLRQINHPIIAPIEDFGAAKDGRPYAATPFVSVTSLSQINQSGKPAASVVDALTLIRQLADAFNTAHVVGLTHPNLTPENIFIREDGCPLLLDLMCPPGGTAVLPRQIEFLDYASPEQRRGKSVTSRSNIYTLGVILYEMLAGHRPRIPQSEWSVFEKPASPPREEPLSAARPGLTQATYRLVRDCLWPQAWSRFETMAKMTAALDAAIQAEQARPSTPDQPTASRRPHWLVPVIIVVILLLIAAGVFFLGGS